jgi:MFS family permease
MGDEKRPAQAAAVDDDSKKWFLEPKHAALLGPFVDFLGLGAIFPLIPYFVKDQNANVVWLGAIISVQYIAVTIGSQFFGWLCDRKDPKHVMVAVMAMDVVFFFLSGIAPDVLTMVLVRMCAGFFTPMPVGTAWIGITVADSDKPKAFYLATLSILSGFITGTALGGISGSLFWACTVSAVLAGCAALLVWFGAAPLAPGARLGVDGEAVTPSGVKTVLATFEWRACALISYNCGQEGACAGPVAGYLFATRFGYSERETGWVFCGLVASLLFVNVALMGVITRMARALPRTLILGLAETPAYVGLVVLFTMAEPPPHADKIFIGLCVCLFMFNCMLHPTSFELGSGYAERWGSNCQGTVLGVQNSAFAIGQAVGPLVAVALLDMQVYYCFLFMYAGLVLVLAANGAVWLREKVAGKEQVQEQVQEQEQEQAQAQVQVQEQTEKPEKPAKLNQVVVAEAEAAQAQALA